MISIITSRTREVQSRRPRGPHTLNYGSQQALGLVGWWNAGLENMYNLNNAAYTRFNLTAGGGPTLTYDNDMGPVFKFVSASSQYFELAGTGAITAVPLSVTSWCRSNDTTNNQSIFCLKNSASAATRDLFQCFIQGTGPPASIIGSATASGSGFSQANSVNTWAANTWMHTAHVFTSATLRASFLNGGGKGTETTSRVPSGINTTSLGRRVTTPFIYMSGMIADVRLYNRALQDWEVWEQYQPRTRWELYYPIGRISYFFALTVAAGFVPYPWQSDGGMGALIVQ